MFQSIESDNYLKKHSGTMGMLLYERVIKQRQEWEGDKVKVLKLSMCDEPFTNPQFVKCCELPRKQAVSRKSQETQYVESADSHLHQQRE